MDEPNPSFYQIAKTSTPFPGTAPLIIEVWDWDTLFGDDLIGKTVIDLEDRYFSSKWRLLTDKPIEKRPLLVDSSRSP